MAGSRIKIKGYKEYVRNIGDKQLHKWERHQGKAMVTITELESGYRLYYNPVAAFATNFIIKEYEELEECLFYANEYIKNN